MNPKERKREYQKRYQAENKEKLREARRLYYLKNKERLKEAATQYYQNYKEKRKELSRLYHLNNKEKRKEAGRKYYLQNIRRTILFNIKSRCRRNNIPFNLTLEDITPPEICPVFGIPLEKGDTKINPNSPSVDRINPELGYVKGNIQVISFKANTMKSNATPEELIQFANWVLKEYGQCQEATS